MIAQNESDHATRAFMIFECLVPPGQEGKSFWDAGQNQYVTAEAVRRGMRLDPPYDIILMYDILDHQIDKNPVDVLAEAKALLSPDGIIVARMHPWCSRHATHLYHKYNKAYLHLLMSESELTKAGLVGTPTRKDVTPPTTYRNWIDAAGLSVVYEELVRQPVEGIFKQQQVMNFITLNDKSLMDITYVDYLIEKL